MQVACSAHGQMDVCISQFRRKLSLSGWRRLVRDCGQVGALEHTRIVMASPPRYAVTATLVTVNLITFIARDHAPVEAPEACRRQESRGSGRCHRV